MTFQDLPYYELDRLHRQARTGLRQSLDMGNEPAYRHAQALERKARREKIRRAMERSP